MTEGWQVPAILRTSLGDLEFNTVTSITGVASCIYKLVPERCQARRGMRATVDDVPQDDGEIFHRRFSNGVEFDITLQCWESDSVIACNSDARLMQEELARWLESMKNESGRFLWQPTGGAGQRMMDEARWLTPISESLAEAGAWELAFTIDTPFPYVMTAAQNSVAVPDGVPTAVPNGGNVPFYPVIIADGPFSTLTIDNQTEGLTITYDSGRPGAIAVGPGDIAEFDAFRATVYLGIGGTPGDVTIHKRAIDPTDTDYFTISPGSDTILSTGADLTFLVNDAWHP
jgi:hypothetical protein